MATKVSARIHRLICAAAIASFGVSSGIPWAAAAESAEPTGSIVPTTGGIPDAAGQAWALLLSLGSWRGAHGRVRCAKLRLGPLTLSNAHARISSGGKTDSLAIENFRAALLDGKVSGRAEAAFLPSGAEPSPPGLKFALDFDAVPLRFWNSSGTSETTAPEDAAGKAPQPWRFYGSVCGCRNTGEKDMDLGIAGRIEKKGGISVENVTVQATIPPGSGSAMIREFSFRMLGAQFRGTAQIAAVPIRPAGGGSEAKEGAVRPKTAAPSFDAGLRFDAGFSGLRFGELMKVFGREGMAADWLLSGRIRGWRALGGDGIHAEVAADIQGSELDRPPPMNGFRARATVADSLDSAKFEEFSLQAYGGELSGSLGFALPGEAPAESSARKATTVNFDIRFSGMRIAEILKDFGRDDLGCSGLLSGRVRGGRKAGEDAMRAEILASVRGGNLGCFPLAASTVSLRTLVDFSKDKIENCELDCELGPEGVTIRQFVLSSCNGELALRAMPGGRLDSEWRFHDFYLKPEAVQGFVGRLPLLGQVTEMIGEAHRRAVCIKVEGTLFAPKFSLAPFGTPKGEKR